MNKTTRVLAILSAATLSLGLAACGSGNQDQGNGSEQSQSSTSQSGSQSGADAAPYVDRDPKIDLPEIGEGDGGAPTMKPVDTEPPTDITVKVLKEGDGEIVQPDDTITVDYAGFLWSNGEQFDSSFERGQAATFSLNQVVSGWKWGLAETRVGDRVELIVPPEYGYGDSDQGSIPAGSTLVFVVDIKAAYSVSPDVLKDAKPTEEKTPAGLVIEGEIGSEPTITFEPSAKAPTEAETIQLTEGTGPVITDTDQVIYYGVGTSWGTESQPGTWEQYGTQTAPAGTAELVGRKVGSRLLLVIPAEGDQSPAQAFIVDIVAAIPEAK